MWSKRSRLFYAARGIFSGDLGCIFKTYNIALLSFKKFGGNPESGQNYVGAGFRPDLEK